MKDNNHEHMQGSWGIPEQDRRTNEDAKSSGNAETLKREKLQARLLQQPRTRGDRQERTDYHKFKEVQDELFRMGRTSGEGTGEHAEEGKKTPGEGHSFWEAVARRYPVLAIILPVYADGKEGIVHQDSNLAQMAEKMAKAFMEVAKMVGKGVKAIWEVVKGVFGKSKK